MAKQYWLMKSEPSVYSIDDLARDKETFWDGVRNYQARNFLRDSIKKGDEVLFYHSRINPPAIAGRAKVVREGYPDHTQFDAGDKHFDPKSSESNPRWFMVDIAFVSKFKTPVSIDALKDIPNLANMVLLNNSRLSVQPVTKEEWDTIVKLAK